MIAESLSGLARPVGDLRVLDGNPRRGDVQAIMRSLRKFGQRKPVVAREDGTVIAGNHTLLAARELGWPEIAVVFTEDDDATAKAFALADNRTSVLGGFDVADLAAMAVEVHAVDPELLEAASFDLDELLGREPESRNDPDDVPEPPAEPVTRPGDLWQLGPHRLLCGDATSPDHLALVTAGLEVGIVYTDPPYGVDIVSRAGKVGAAIGYPFGGAKNGKQGSAGTVRTTAYLPVAGDESTDAASDAFRLLTAEYPGALHVWWGGNHYAASADLPDSSCWLVWDKDTNGNFADAELAWTNHDGAVRLFRHMWNGMLRASERGKRVHPTQKPVALAEWAFGVIDPKAERSVVLDAFAGSGSTLIAAHRTQRTAALIEMEPAYCDVICRRYAEHTGTKPVLEATGEPFAT